MTNEPKSTAMTDRSGGVETAVLEAAVRRAGRHHGMGRAASAPLRNHWLDVTYVGRENVPVEGPVMLAANHLSFIDSLLVMYSLDRPVTFLGKAEYLAHPIARRLFPTAGMLPIDRSGRRSRVTLDRVQEILNDGGVVGVHPEGTRSRDGRLNPGHRGVAQMALRAGAPVVPIALVGTDRVQPIGQKFPSFRGEVEIRFGAPIGLGPWANAPRSAISRNELTEEIMQSIAALSGQQRRFDATTTATASPARSSLSPQVA